MISNIKKQLPLSAAILFVLAGLVFRYYSLYFVSYDMKIFLIDWYDTIAKNGFAALRKPFSNYTPPYLYLIWITTLTKSFLPKVAAIKLISIFFDLCNGILIYKILKIKYPEGKIAPLGMGIFLLLPTILLNSSYWGQADSIYTCFLLACLYFLIKEKPLYALIFFGISFSFKAQAIFLTPLLLLLVVRKRIPWLYLGIVPLIYILMMLPALITGRPFLDVMTIYNSQVNTYRSLSLNAPNLYVFISNGLYTPVVRAGIIMTFVIVVTWVSIYARRIEVYTPGILVICAYVSAAIVPFFLPKMHDRYFYTAEALSLLVAFYFPQFWFFSVGHQIISGMTYYIFLFLPVQDPVRNVILTTAALANTIIICLVLIAQWVVISKSNLSLAEPVSFFSTKAGNKWRERLISFWVKVMNQMKLFIVKWRVQFIFILIISIGIFSRVLKGFIIPPGLNPDEASIGVEAYYLYKYGIDRNGISYPVHLISWGSGQNALYAYLILPLVALKGLTTASIRLPMLLSGLLSMPLVYLAGKKLFGEKFGLLAMFFMAISPWHIINSRWAVESNIMPFLFLAGFTLLVFSSPRNHWFTLACVFFASCLYAYGTAYAGVPVFLSLAIPALIYTKQITFKQAITGLTVFSVLALPIALFVIINTFQYDAIHLGLVTIPRMPVEARYETMAAVFGNSPLQTMSENIGIMFKMLWTQEDAYPWNHVRPFGYFYKVTFPLAVMGFLLAIPRKAHPEENTGRWLLLAWIIASLVIGAVHPTNLTRLNLVFTPILLCIALFVLEADKHIKRFLPVAIFALLIGFVLFIRIYHGEEYQKRASGVFNSGMIPAVEFASEKGKSSICFTESTYSSYIYVLFTKKIHPSEYINNIEWLYPSDPADPARTPREIGRYHFRLSDCSEDKDAVYVLLLKETPPDPDIKYKSKKFDKFRVYFPQE